MTFPSLDIIANTVTPPQIIQDYRRLKYRLRNIAGGLLKNWQDGKARDHRTTKCGRYMIGGQVSVALKDCKARFVGVETCGSVWSCPVCASKIAEKRREDIAKVLEAHIAGNRRIRLGEAKGMNDWQEGMKLPYIVGKSAKGAVYMATFTMRHNLKDRIGELKEALIDGWRRMARGAPWDRAKEKFGVVGMIRGLEVTFGFKNGWHPHLHILMLTSQLTEEQEANLRLWLFERWAKIIDKLGGNASFDALDLKRAYSVEEAGEYVAKWGADSEIAKSFCKRGKGESLSPWGLLEAASNGDRQAGRLWREYYEAFAGTRQITWSRGLREMYLDDQELTDDEIASEEALELAEIVLGNFRRPTWHRIVEAGVLPEVLDAAEAGGWAAVLSLLKDRRLILGVVNDDERSGARFGLRPLP